MHKPSPGHYEDKHFTKRDEAHGFGKNYGQVMSGVFLPPSRGTDVPTALINRPKWANLRTTVCLIESSFRHQEAVLIGCTHLKFCATMCPSTASIEMRPCLISTYRRRSKRSCKERIGERTTSTENNVDVGSNRSSFEKVVAGVV